MPPKYLSDVSSGRENNFDFFRFVLATLVIYSHSFPLLLTIKVAAGVETFKILTRGQATGGELAVDGFFVISGFLITKSWISSRGLWDYLKKRILRIVPGFVAASLLCVLVLGPIAAVGAREYFRGYPVHGLILSLLKLEKPPMTATLLHNPIPSEVNGSLWTIRYEFYCYLIVAALGVAGLLKRRIVPLALLGVSVAAFTIQYYRLIPDGSILAFLVHHDAPLNFVTFFLSGAAFYLFSERIPYSRGALLLSLVALALASVTNGLTVALPIFGAYALLYAAFNRSFGRQHFARRGDLSYGIYLYAWPAQQLLIFYFARSLNPYLLFICAVPITFCCAALSWNLVERPSLRLKSKPASPAPALATTEPDVQTPDPVSVLP